MPASIDLYTTANMEKVEVDSSPTEAAGHPIENAFDNNPDTYWSPTGTSAETITIDLQEAKYGHAIILLLKDYGTDYDAAVASTLQLNGSSDGVTWTGGGSGVAILTAASIANDQNGPIYIRQFGSTQQWRYWRIIITGNGRTPQISGIFICRKFTLSLGNQFPEPDLDQFVGDHRDTIKQLTRTYMLTNSTDLNYLINAFKESRRGNMRYPVILQEGSNDSDAVLCKFMDDGINRNQISYQIWKPTVHFEGIPYIKDGELY